MIAGEHEFPGIPTQPTGLFARLINGFSYCHARWHFAWRLPAEDLGCSRVCCRARRQPGLDPRSPPLPNAELQLKTDA
jgi:hypothetical protein